MNCLSDELQIEVADTTLKFMSCLNREMFVVDFISEFKGDFGLYGFIGCAFSNGCPACPKEMYLGIFFSLFSNFK